jgi:LacI family transcriptional regulator
MKAVWDAGLRVPEDVAIVGAGDVAYSDLIRVPLTTVRWSKREVGTSAAELILDQIEGEGRTRPKRVIIPPEIVVRQSA